MRSDQEKLLDIIEACERIEKYAVFGRERFEQDELVQTWFVQNLQIVGEACRSLSSETRDLAPDIPWKQAIGMRNVLAHAYFEIDFDLVWSAVSISIPTLKPQIKNLLEQLS